MLTHKRIGILTITHPVPKSMNYGNRLQNYALQETLKKLGHDVKTVLYVCVYPPRESRTVRAAKFFARPVKRFLVSAARRMFHEYRKAVLGSSRWGWHEKICGFDEFVRTKIRLTDEMYSIGSDFSRLDEEFDCMIAGSDQVWNPYWEGTQPIFFMEFVPPKKRIAYAASFGVGEIPDRMKEEYRRCLAQIPRISCREDMGCDLVEELTGKRPEHVLDPVFLMERQEWAELERCPAGMNLSEPYVLAYFLGATADEAKQKAASLRHSGLQVVYLDKCFEVNSCFASPQEFLYLVDHAQMVLTDSFHGCAFSIIFNTSFQHFVRKSHFGTKQDMNSRFTSLFRQLHCGAETSDFTEANRSILNERKKALAFMKSALSE